jgi:hypothetical protein
MFLDLDFSGACAADHHSIRNSKARVAMVVLSGEKTLAEPWSEFGVHPKMIST